MSKQLTVKDCKTTLFNIGIKLGVSPALISNRLLSKEDKQDMLDGNLPVDAILVAVTLWKQQGFPDYANGEY